MPCCFGQTGERHVQVNGTPVEHLPRAGKIKGQNAQEKIPDGEEPDHFEVGKAFRDGLLVEVLAVGFPEPLPFENSPEQGERCIDPEHGKQQGPGSKTALEAHAGADAQTAEHVAEIPAPSVAHEKFRGGPVPEEESERCRCRYPSDGLWPEKTETAGEISAGQADHDGFSAGQSVDAIHEVVKIDCPGDPQNAEQFQPVR